MLSVVMLSVTYAECRYAECRCAFGISTLCHTGENAKFHVQLLHQVSLPNAFFHQKNDFAEVC
jgi:hypothetical protein